MPIVGAKGSPSSGGFGEFAQVTAANYIEDVFSTYLYDGNSSTQTITNGIDLSTKGGLVWAKSRNTANFHLLVDTVRGFNSEIYSNSTSAASTSGSDYTSWNTNGYSLGFISGNENVSGRSFVSWTFRKQPKFFDIVTYTGTGSARTVAHSLGAVPGCIIVKRTDTAGFDWIVYHRSTGNTNRLLLNDTVPAASGTSFWNDTTPTSTVFTVGTNVNGNASGGTYVAYLFAHDAGGFGLEGTDNVISCGSFTTDGSGDATVSLGYEPQWVMLKASSTGGNWEIDDTFRGMPVTGNIRDLLPNSSAAESVGGALRPSATGFYTSGALGGSSTYIYIAIRRGPMKVPTLGTSVFDVDTLTPAANLTGTKVTNPFATDLLITTQRDHAGLPSTYAVDRLRGGSVSVATNSTGAEQDWGTTYSWKFDYNDGFLDNFAYPQGTVTTPMIYWSFKRAPGFFDEVCYTGNGGSNRQISHNLTSVPELLIVKSRSRVQDWRVLSTALSQNSRLNGTNAFQTINTELYFGDDTSYIAPTSSVFTIGSSGDVNANNGTYVAYLFATCPGVSKVFSYTGNGSSQTINCGFTGGARFVLIKRTDSTGDWYVWDSARGIVAGNDPHLSLNTTAAEVTTDDSVDTDTTGFIVNQVAATNVNVSSATYIGLAVA